LIKTKKVYKITIWGSDFFRATQRRKEKQRKYYLNAKLIQMATKEIQEEFLQCFPSVSSKIRLVRFGISQFDCIDRCKEKKRYSLLPVNTYKDKILITCGYNGSKVQQHALIIQSINELREDQKNKIILLLPMTYGATEKYINETKQLLSQTGITYHLFPSHLSNEYNAQLRVLTDIAVNIQITDALSGSLQEHLYAGNLLLAGDWLPYRIFDEIDIFYQKTSLNKLTESLSYCIDNLDILKEKTKDNPVKIRNLSSWESVAPVWANIYDEFLK
jgi:site-specific recombinase XerD